MTTTGKFDTRPAKVEEWIAALPLADVGESARLVLHALRDINHSNINDRHRFQILELFRDPTLYIANALQKLYIGQEFPLPPRKRGMNEMERDVLSELAQGYKVVVNNLVDKDTGLNTTLSATSIHRAIRYLGRVLITCYKSYSPAPENTWKEIHHLYYYAELRDLYHVPVNDMENWFAARTNIEDIYKQIILLAMADPYHLAQNETDKIDVVIGIWAPKCRLLDAGDSDNRSGMFGVNLDSDEQPRPVTAADMVNVDDWRILDTSGLTQIMRSLGESPDSSVRAVPEDARTAMTKEFLQHLMYSWGITPKRRSHRLPSNSKVVVTLGLSSTHHFAEMTAHFASTHNSKEIVDPLAETRESLFNQCKSPVNRQPDKKRLPEFSTRSEFDGKVAEGLHVSERRVLTMKDFLKVDEYHGDIPDLETADEIAATPLFDAFECETVNESNEGTRLRWACLAWEGANSPRMRVGELVSIRGLGMDGRQWIIGAIRWMKKTADSAFEFGVQFLSPAAQAVAICVRNLGGAKFGDYQRSLLLPAITSINRPATLITPALIFRQGDKVRLNIDGVELEVALITALHKGSFFGHYQFSVIDAVKDDEPDADDSNAENQADNVNTSADNSTWEII